MAKRSEPARPQKENYWARRVRSPQFKKGLRRVVGDALRDLGTRPVDTVVSAAAVKRSIQNWDFAGIDRDVVADFLVAAERHFTERLKRDRRSMLEILGPELADDVEALLTEDGHLPPFVDDFVAHMLEQEFVRKLLTDLIFIAIEAFNRKVNPVFGAMTTYMLEDQIKGFIRLFMPTLQRQAVAFATSRTNQRLVLDLSLAFVRQLLKEPVAHYAELQSPAQRRQSEVVLRKALKLKDADDALRRAAANAWDDLYGSLKHRTIGEIADVNSRAGDLTDLIVAALRLLFERDAVAGFITEELTVAATAST